MKQVRPKNPARRRVAASAAALAAALAGAPALRPPAYAQTPAPPGEPPAATACPGGATAATLPTLAVLDVSFVTFGRAAADEKALRSGLADMLITELAANPCVRVVERREVQRLLGEQDLGASGRVDPETAARIGRVLGAHHVIIAAVTLDPRNDARLDARAVHVETSRVEVGQSVTGRADNVLRLVADLGGRLNRALRLPPLPTRAPRPTSGEASWRAAQLYGRALMAQERGDVEAAGALYREALDVSPQFDRARVQLAALTRGAAGP